jgi:Transglutaminase-like superfamily
MVSGVVRAVLLLVGLVCGLLGMLGQSMAQTRDLRSDMREVRRIAELVTPAVKSAGISDLRRALLLRDQVYRASLFEVPGVPFTTSAEIIEIGEAYRKAILERDRSNLCNGKAILFMAALRSFGIKSRMVALYRDIQDAPTPAFTHASVDVLIGGQWIALDPYFNLSFRAADGAYLGWTEVVKRVRANLLVVHSSDGFAHFKTQTISAYENEYGSPFVSLLRHVILTPTADSDIVSLNPEWDGILRYRNGETFDAYASARWPFFKELATPEKTAE